MNINSLLDDEGDQSAVRLTLIQIRDTLAIAAHDYAKDCLLSAQTAYDIAFNYASCAEVWVHVLKAQSSAEKAHKALDNCMASLNLIAMSEETGDEEIDQINTEIKIDQVEVTVISALLEGAQTRLNLTYVMIPDNPAPGARCIPENLKSVEDDNTEPESESDDEL